MYRSPGESGLRGAGPAARTEGTTRAQFGE